MSHVLTMKINEHAVDNRVIIHFSGKKRGGKNERTNRDIACASREMMSELYPSGVSIKRQTIIVIFRNRTFVGALWRYVLQLSRFKVIFILGDLIFVKFYCHASRVERLIILKNFNNSFV